MSITRFVKYFSMETNTNAFLLTFSTVFPFLQPGESVDIFTCRLTGKASRTACSALSSRRWSARTTAPARWAVTPWTPATLCWTPTPATLCWTPTPASTTAPAVARVPAFRATSQDAAAARPNQPQLTPASLVAADSRRNVRAASELFFKSFNQSSKETLVNNVEKKTKYPRKRIFFLGFLVFVKRKEFLACFRFFFANFSASFFVF